MGGPTAAFSVAARTFLFAEAIWDDPQGDDVNQRWLRRAMATIDRHAIGHYIAGADPHADSDRSRLSFTASAWQRLSQMRERRDPDNLFHTYLGLEAARAEAAAGLAKQKGERLPDSP